MDLWDPEMGCQSVKTMFKCSVLMYPIATCPLYSQAQPPGPTKTQQVAKRSLLGQKLQFCESFVTLCHALESNVTSFSGKLNLFLPWIFRQTQATENCRCYDTPNMAKMPILAVFRAQSQVCEHLEPKWVIVMAYFFLSHLLLWYEMPYKPLTQFFGSDPNPPLFAHSVVHPAMEV